MMEIKKNSYDAANQIKLFFMNKTIQRRVKSWRTRTYLNTQCPITFQDINLLEDDIFVFENNMRYVFLSAPIYIFFINNIDKIYRDPLTKCFTTCRDLRILEYLNANNFNQQPILSSVRMHMMLCPGQIEIEMDMRRQYENILEFVKHYFETEFCFDCLFRRKFPIIFENMPSERFKRSIVKKSLEIINEIAGENNFPKSFMTF